MGKYETRFKLKVVESFLAGQGGAHLAVGSTMKDGVRQALQWFWKAEG